MHRQVRRGSLFDVDKWVDTYEVFLYTLWDAAITGHLSTGGARYIFVDLCVRVRMCVCKMLLYTLVDIAIIGRYK